MNPESPGSVEESALWSRVLTPAEMQQLSDCVQEHGRLTPEVLDALRPDAYELTHSGGFTLESPVPL